MTTTSRPRRRRKRGSHGFWKSFRHATHTDHLKHRLGGAAGRATIRAINRRRVRKGKAPIPQRGGDWFSPTGSRPRVAGSPVRRPAARPAAGPRPVRPSRPRTAPRPTQVKAPTTTTKPPARTAGQPAGPFRGQAQMKRAVASMMRAAVPSGPVAQTKAQAAAAGAPPAFSGPYVKAGTGTAAARKVRPGTVSVTGSGIAGPGNRGAGAGIGVPAYGTGGAAGDGDHMLSPGSAGGSATGGAPVPPGGIYGANGGEHAANGWVRTPDGQRVTAGPAPGGTASPAGPPAGGAPNSSSNGRGGSIVSGMAGLEALSETPETDAEYVAALRGLCDEVHGFGERIEEIQASLLEAVGMDQAALGAYGVMAEGAHMMADAAQQATIDFLNTYQGVIETAAAGTKIPGNTGFWTGDVA